MSTRADAAVDRAYDQLAEDYAKRGYRVLRSAGADALPPFLRDHNPRLVAERANDHVVVAVKRTRSLRGSNDLPDLAASVTGEPGWRLELVALGKEADDLAATLEPGWLDAVLQAAGLLAGTARPQPALVAYLAWVMDFLLRNIAVLYKLHVRGQTALRLARDLTSQGILDQDTLDQIEAVNRWRDDLMYDPSSAEDDAQRRTAITALCRDLHAQLLAASDSNPTGQTPS
jgi:hypothetical protein